MAAIMSSATQPDKEDMQQWFEDGRLPCSFSTKLLWEPVLTQLDRLSLEPVLAQFDRLSLINSAESRMEELQQLDIEALKRFVQSAAEVERRLILALEDQLRKDPEGLFDLNEEGSPKLGLLLNCFGADARTIKVLQNIAAKDLILRRERDVKSMVSALPKDQQIVVLYTRERLEKGAFPYSDHECVVCKCETAEEMANLLSENELSKVTADIIRGTGASGRGALLFLSAQDLQLGNADLKALLKVRGIHQKSCVAPKFPPSKCASSSSDCASECGPTEAALPNDPIGTAASKIHGE